MNHLACIALLLLGGLAAGGEVSFSAKPTVKRTGESFSIAFAVSAPTDVEVAIIAADGRMVRHLAAGVLGSANPPPAPLKPGLSQELVWDGKGDWGQPAGEGPFQVRVRAGTSVSFGGTVGDGHHNFRDMVCRGMEVDQKNGDVYLLLTNADASTGRFTLRVYDREGKYLREILPYPGTIDAKSLETFGTVAVPGRPKPVARYYNSYPVIYPFETSKYDPEQESTAMTWRQFGMVALHPADGQVLLLSDHLRSLFRIRQSDGGAVSSPFAEPLWPEGTKLTGMYDCPVGPVKAALTPDGRTMYVTAFCLTDDKTNTVVEAWPEGRVYQVEIGKASMRKFVDVPLAADRPVLKKQQNVYTGQQTTNGLMVDKGGRVYVCDRIGGKVLIYTPAGQPAGSLSVPDAYDCALDEKTGVLYVLTSRPALHGRCHKSLVKLSGTGADAKVLDTLQFPEQYGSYSPFLAADFSAATPRLWVWGCPRVSSLARIEEQGGKLAIVEDLADRGALASGFAAHVEVDREQELVYVKQGAAILRYHGVTGEYAGEIDRNKWAKPIEAPEFCIRRDGMIYLSGSGYAGGGWSGAWRRLNRDLTPAPWPDGKAEAGYRYAKRHPLPLWWGAQGSCVTPEGWLYANAMPARRFASLFETAPDGKAGRGPRMQEFFQPPPDQQPSGYIKAGYTGVLVGPLQDETGGVKVDQQGNLYIGLRVLPLSNELPADLAELDRLGNTLSVPYDRTLGSVVRFKPSGGALWPQGAAPGSFHKPTFYSGPANLPGVKVPEKLEAGLSLGKATKMEKTFLEGATRAYPGLSGFSSSCRCRTPRFEVDDYGRIYIPDGLSNAVRVYDNEGNRILTFGAYGNHDSAGPEVPLICPMGVAVSYKHIYVADEVNRRVVRADKRFAAEETLALK